MTRAFKRVLIFTMVFLAIVAVLSGGKTLYYFLFTTVIIWLAMRVMVRHNERNLYILYYASEHTIHSGDVINIGYKISNTSFIPIFHAVIDFKLDQRMNTESSLQEIAYFRNYDRINFSKDIVCKYRGYYKIGQVQVALYDPLLLNQRLINFNKEIDITVYPKVVPIRQRLIQSQDFYGTLKSYRKTIEDRTNIVNIRPYIQGDQLKNIHWKLSAKKDSLHTKEFEQTVSNKLIVMLDGQTFETANKDFEELMVSFGASLIKTVLDDDTQIKVLLNDSAGTVMEGNQSSDFQSFLEMLTSFVSDGDVHFAHFVNRHIAESVITDTKIQTTTVLITQNISETFFEELRLRDQKIDLFTFSPQTQEARECIARHQSKSLRFHFINQILDVDYGQ